MKGKVTDNLVKIIFKNGSILLLKNPAKIKGDRSNRMTDKMRGIKE